VKTQTSRATGDDGDLALKGEDVLEVNELDVLCGRHGERLIV
jgi:hypothetical protein